MWKKLLYAITASGLSLTAHAAGEPPHPFANPSLYGQPIWIGEGADRTAALYAEANQPRARGLVVLLHSVAEHPEWPQVIRTLRQDLTDHGWSTLALQLPAPPPNSGHYNAAALAAAMQARVEQALDYARQWDPPHIVLIGHGMGAAVALNSARALGPDRQLLAVVAISPSADPNDPAPLDTGPVLSQLNLPILDVSAELDRLEVVNSREARARAARRAGNTAYRQLVIPGADHHYNNHAAPLAKRVRSWLDAQYRKLPEAAVTAARRSEETLTTEPSTAPMAPMTGPAVPAMTEVASPGEPSPPAETVSPPSTPATPAPMSSTVPTTPAAPTNPTPPPSPTGPGGLF